MDITEDDMNLGSALQRRMNLNHGEEYSDAERRKCGSKLLYIYKVPGLLFCPVCLGEYQFYMA